MMRNLIIKKPDVIVWSWPWMSFCFGWTYYRKKGYCYNGFYYKPTALTVCIGFLTLRWHW